MAPSPSSSLNTPGGVGATPSPQQEDQAYRDKVRQLSKYIEPLRRMIAKMSSEGSKEMINMTNNIMLKCMYIMSRKQIFKTLKKSIKKKKKIYSMKIYIHLKNYFKNCKYLTQKYRIIFIDGI